MIDMEIPKHNTSRDITLDSKMIRSTSEMFGRKFSWPIIQCASKFRDVRGRGEPTL